MKTSIVILTYNKLDFTKQCIESIREYTVDGTYELIVVDNCSNDGTVEWLKEQNDIKVIYNQENLGFPKGCNQGIEISTGDNILLLNNDVIVTKNWLSNLNTALYSSDDIGAVGPVTNSASYYTAISTNYKSLSEMHDFAKSFNQSNPEEWEYRLKLIGYCMLIKREVIDKIGMLDEIFTPGNFEDDDYSFRILQAGFKLLLCKDTFIHHYGGASFGENIEKYADVLKRNGIKFEEKWGFMPSYSTYIRNEVINLIDSPQDQPINVLEIGCACGGTLLKIKSKYKHANLYGIEFNESASLIASQFADVKAQDAEKEMDYPTDYFDYIILADVLEHLYNPWQVMKNIRNHLKDNGKVLISIPNVMHFSLLRSVINGNWTYTDSGLLDRTHVRFFTLNEINKMLTEAEYSNIEYNATTVAKKREDEEFIQSLTRLSAPSMESQYNAYQYIIKATKNDVNMKLKRKLQIIEGKLNSGDVDKATIELSGMEQFSSDEIIENICKHLKKKVEILNLIAINNFGQGLFDEVLPYLEKAFELNKDDSDTLYNIIFVLNSLGESKLALEYFRLSKVKDQELISLYQGIQQHSPIYNLLMNLDENPNDMEAKNQLVSIIREDDSLVCELKEIIKYCFDSKTQFLTLVDEYVMNLEQ
ncbi:bifunctional glycosyltransferase family 2 protein/class I SAM-dependent methyltransferase [Ferdinandcohnia quinoae]|uniref:Bifunctional glycosyltransferase family 2 protein/class I SAM-dependent methyltransferase n=1 Tax=Fredinandcohnia quinoae TaxID=2918902 RepID=A0AAW5DWP2_9BACI|nr:bifunctional glycosyltransferase family 2 protein/class I SAM-dependent methyltransferase [Fredinandcohnia sp. SECRCQ15]MCH1625065.1 bifunctional glycosyltransferase family 2 protein/class I SAM-dependent methyltransferase [Fredinandcohnia sp. SECRCQ15]